MLENITGFPPRPQQAFRVQGEGRESAQKVEERIHQARGEANNCNFLEHRRLEPNRPQDKESLRFRMDRTRKEAAA